MRELTVLPKLRFTEAISSAWNKLTHFKGRSRRSEYWFTVLGLFIILFSFNILYIILDALSTIDTIYLIKIFFRLILPLLTFLGSILLIPITFRRLHDTGKSGWWYGVSIFAYILTLVSTGFIYRFLCFAYITYSLVLLIFLCEDSQKETNKYGESPKYKETEELHSDNGLVTDL